MVMDSDERAGGGGAPPAGNGDPAAAEALSGVVTTLQAEVEALRQQAAERLAGWQRAQADYENLRKRSQQDVEDRVAQRTSRLLLDVLAIGDDLERALRAPAADAEAWVSGVRLIGQKLERLLEREGVQPLPAAGQAFDPQVHEALGALPGPRDTVVAEVERGYVLGRRVLRPARVMVGNGSPAADVAGPGNAPEAERGA